MKYIKILIIALVVTSCDDDFLNLDPISSIKESEYYTTDQEVYSGVIGMYDAIQGNNFSVDGFDNESISAGIQYEFYVTEMRSDNTFMRDTEGESGDISLWEISASNTIVANYYKSFYEVIFRANKVLESIDGADEENQQRYEAEARFVRAYAYFNLVRLFGDIPYLDSIEDVDTDAQFTRVSETEVYTYIIEDLLMAESALDNSSKSRASQAAAKALLAKVYLTTGNYTGAKILCKDIIDSEEFALQENFKDIFYNELNSEIIFSVGYVSDNESESQGLSELWASLRENGINNLTENIISAFSSDEGENRSNYSFYFDGENDNLNRGKVGKFLAAPNASLGINPSAINQSLAGNDWIILRYADVYLMFVEAVMADLDEIDVTITTDEDLATAKFCFEEIRRRAGVENYTVSTISKEELLNERRLELAFENHRFFDLVRFDVALEVLQEYGVQELGRVFTEFDLLLPIPEREITLSGDTMRQNDGY